MVDSPQGPGTPTEKSNTEPLEQAHAIVERWKQKPPAPPPEFLMFIEWFCGWLPIVLLLCGLFASIVLFFSGCFLGSEYHDYFYAAWCLVALAFFVGPLLFGIAGIVHRLNQGKRD